MVNNAGLSISKPIEEHTEKDWDLLYDVLVKGQFLVTQAGLSIMRKQDLGGDVINIVSKNALVSGPNNTGYGSAKAAQLHLSRLTAAELGDDEIRVNVVNPDAVISDSKIWKGAWADGRAKAYGISVEELPSFYAKRTLLNEIINPADIANACFAFVGGLLNKSIPASQRPLDKALKAQIRTQLLTTKKQTVANKWFTTFQKKLEKTVRYATGFAPAKTTSTAATTARRRRRPRPADAADGGRTGSERRLARRRAAGRMRRRQRVGEQRAPGVAAVVDGQNITVSDLETTMHIAKLSLKTSYPEPGTRGLGLPALARARVARARRRVARLGARTWA